MQQEVIEVQVQEYQPPAPPQTPNSTPPDLTSTPEGQVTPPARQPNSRLGGVVVSVTLLAIGALGVADLAGASVRPSAYIATPLVAVALGLIIGAWYGRARWLIAIGVVLSLALGIVATTERLGLDGQSVTWRPTTIEQMDRSYTIDAGTAVLDLSTLNFSGRSAAVDVSVGVGDLTIIVPTGVDVRAEATIDVGSANVFGTSWDGIGQSTRLVTDNDADGPGGGELIVRASVDVGNLEVRR